MRYVREHGLTDKTTVRVETVNNLLELHWQADGRVTVDMNAPVFDPPRVPFDAAGLVPREVNGFELWPLEAAGRRVEVAVLSMGNPHAVQRVDDVDAAPVAALGPAIEGHARFARRVNAGFMQVRSRGEIALRVLRARRRRNAGLRHRRLRGRGGGHPARLARCPRRRAHARRPADDRMARRRPAGADDRPGRNGFRRRDRTVITNALQGITENDIADYLANTPGFFERHAELLATIQLTSPHGQRAVSLQERQMEMLRERIKGLEKKIVEMIRNGQDNVAIAERLHRWTRRADAHRQPGRTAAGAGAAS